MRAYTILAAAILSVVAPIPVSAQADRPLTLVSWGGSYQKAQRETQWEPAAKEHGFTFREATVSNSYAEIKLQVQSKNVTWDIVQMGSFEVDQAAAEGLIEKLDYTQIARDDYLPGMARDYCLATIAYSTVLAYNPKKFAQNPPRTWADYWDVKKYPGNRAFNGNRAISVLEIATQADGVPPAMSTRCCRPRKASTARSRSLRS
jgi:putative spermidine/putrescine transport system substrate-binding protein